MYSIFSLRGKLTSLSAALLGLLLATPAAAQAPFDPPGLDRAIEAKDFHVDRLMATDGVVAVGVGLTARGQAAIVIMTEDRRVTGLARSLDGVPVVVRVTGAFHAINKPDADGKHDHGDDTTTEEEPPADPAPTVWWPRPVPIGVSTGHPNITAGTIGARVTDGPNVYALSNNHVYADENNADIGDNVLQPGSFDGGDPDDAIGTLDAFVEIVFGGIIPNDVDAAIALSSLNDLGNATPSDGYGMPNSMTAGPAACLNKRVQKYGRTTSLTKGIAFVIDATVTVDYGDSGIALFVHQIVVDGGKGGFILPGDSGSLLVLRRGKKPCGLLFAGTSTGKYGIANQIDLVLIEFGVSIDGD